MRYDTITLPDPVETVRERIAAKVADVRTRTEASTTDYYTNAGVHVATITPAAGSDGSKLRYRTAFVRPHLGHARRKAQEIRAVVESASSGPA